MLFARITGSRWRCRRDAIISYQTEPQRSVAGFLVSLYSLCTYFLKAPSMNNITKKYNKTLFESINNNNIELFYFVFANLTLDVYM